MVASDFGAGGFGEMGKLGWSDLWDGGQGRGVGCGRVRGSRMRSLVQGRFDAGGKNRGIGKKLLMSFGNRVGRRMVSQGWWIWCERTKKRSGKRMS